MADNESQAVTRRGWLVTSQLGRGLLQPERPRGDVCQALNSHPYAPISLLISPHPVPSQI